MPACGIVGTSLGPSASAEISDGPYGNIENQESITAPHVPSPARRTSTSTLPEQQLQHVIGNAPISGHSHPCTSSEIFPFRSCRWADVKTAREIDADFPNVALRHRPRQSRRPRATEMDLQDGARGHGCPRGPRSHGVPSTERTTAQRQVASQTFPSGSKWNSSLSTVARRTHLSPRRTWTSQKVTWACRAPPAGLVRRMNVLAGSGNCRVAFHCIRDFETEFDVDCWLEAAERHDG